MQLLVEEVRMGKSWDVEQGSTWDSQLWSDCKFKLSILISPLYMYHSSLQRIQFTYSWDVAQYSKTQITQFICISHPNVNSDQLLNTLHCDENLWDITKNSNSKALNCEQQFLEQNPMGLSWGCKPILDIIALTCRVTARSGCIQPSVEI